MYVLESNSTFLRSLVILLMGCGMCVLVVPFNKAESYLLSMILLLFGGYLFLFGMKLIIKPVRSRLVISDASVVLESGVLFKEYDKAGVFGVGYTDSGEDERLFIILKDGIIFELPKALVFGKEERLINDIRKKEVIDLYHLDFSSLKNAYKSSPPRVSVSCLVSAQSPESGNPIRKIS